MPFPPMFRRFIISALEVLEIALITLGAVFVIRTFLIQPFLVSGASMEQNFRNGDYLLIDELTYRFREPLRGEVVVFRYPNNESTYFIKRIIGLPGDEVGIQGGAVVVTNAAHPEGLALSEPYLAPGTKTLGAVHLTLQPGEYFVMGDNRSYSFDSRSWGVLGREDIIGLTRVRLWPVGEAQAFAAPEYSL